MALVLFLVGLECLVLLSAHELMRQVKENVVLSIVLKEDNTTDEVDLATAKDSLEKVGAKVAGIVFNMVNRKSSKYYNSYYYGNS